MVVRVWNRQPKRPGPARDRRLRQHGWRDEVEHAVQSHVTTLRETAGSLIRDHRYQIEELMNYPGVLKANKAKLKEMAAKKGMTGMEGFGSDD